MERVLQLDHNSADARELRMCCSFANSGPLPLLFIDSIFGTHPEMGGGGGGGGGGREGGGG
ncbi:unnamed protein product, partial [Choristocarpus tenellus]